MNISSYSLENHSDGFVPGSSLGLYRRLSGLKQLLVIVTDVSMNFSGSH